MKAPMRHQLAWLDEFAWHRVLATAQPSNDAVDGQVLQTLECLSHWAEQRWPLVVTRQAIEAPLLAPTTRGAPLTLGLPAPAKWGRRALAVSTTWGGVLKLGEFPAAGELVAQLPVAAQEGWRRLCLGLAQLDAAARVYGSHGWQHLTGMDCVHGLSDIDLLVDVQSVEQADQVGALLQSANVQPLRIDGELRFGDGAGVAWREWMRLRSGQVDRVLVKRLAGVTLEDASTWAALA